MRVGLTKRLSKYPLWTIRHAHRFIKFSLDMDKDVSRELAEGRNY